MKVKSIMSREVAVCSPEDSMDVAARLMWEHDCGVVPVVEPASNQLVGVVTDRDLCMAAMLSDRPLSTLDVRDAMAQPVRSCAPRDDVKEAHATMREHQLRRLPVVDEEGAVVGILSVNDLFVEAFDRRGPAATKRQRDVAKTLAAISRHREPEEAHVF